MWKVLQTSRIYFNSFLWFLVLTKCIFNFLWNYFYLMCKGNLLTWGYWIPQVLKQRFVHHYRVLGIKLQSSARAGRALKCWMIVQSPFSDIFQAILKGVVFLISFLECYFCLKKLLGFINHFCQALLCSFGQNDIR